MHFRGISEVVPHATILARMTSTVNLRIEHASQTNKTNKLPRVLGNLMEARRASSVALLWFCARIVPVASWGCEWWCGNWACPGDFCSDCDADRCRCALLWRISNPDHNPKLQQRSAPVRRLSLGKSPYARHPLVGDDQASGSPPGHVAANFEPPFKRTAPLLVETGQPMPNGLPDGAPETGSTSRHPITFDHNAAGHLFTPFHLGTNFPLCDAPRLSNPRVCCGAPIAADGLH